MDEQVWRENVQEYNGAFVLWIDQSSDPLLKQHNSNGVCLAMAFDFVTAYQSGQPLPFRFVNGIRDARLIPPGTSRIPPKYIEIQTAFQAMHVQFQTNLRQINTQLEQAKEQEKPALIKTMREMLDNRIKQRFGPGMGAYEKFNEPNLTAGVKLFQRMSAIAKESGPCYFLISMRDDETGHGIAFGFRPDLSASDNFPGIFEFFDANLGLFVFGTEDKLKEFFNVMVWFDLYTDYSKFEIATFPARRRGIRQPQPSV